MYEHDGTQVSGTVPDTLRALNMHAYLIVSTFYLRLMT